MRGLTWGAVILSLAAVGAIPAQADEWQRTYKVGTRPELRLETDDGGVIVDTWDQKAIEVRVTTNGWGVGSRVGSRRVRVTESQNGDRVDVSIRSPHFGLYVGWSNPTVRIHVNLPRRSDLEIRTGDGSVSVKPLAGRVTIHSGDGAIDVEGHQGQLELDSADGNIEATRVDGTLDVHTGDGAIRVEGRFDELHLDSGDGSISAEARPGSKMGAGWSASTGDGRLSLRIADDLKADLDAHTGDGHIELDFPIEVSGKLSTSTIHGTLNGGGPPLLLRSGDGSIRIERSGRAGPQ